MDWLDHITISGCDMDQIFVTKEKSVSSRKSVNVTNGLFIIKLENVNLL